MNKHNEYQGLISIKQWELKTSAPLYRPVKLCFSPKHRSLTQTITLLRQTIVTRKKYSKIYLLKKNSLSFKVNKDTTRKLSWHIPKTSYNLIEFHRADGLWGTVIITPHKTFSLPMQTNEKDMASFSMKRVSLHEEQFQLCYHIALVLIHLAQIIPMRLYYSLSLQKSILCKLTTPVLQFIYQISDYDIKKVIRIKL